MKAIQTSLFIGFLAVVIIGVIGVTVGSIAGYFGGWVDNVLMRIVDVVLSLPYLFLILLIVACLGHPGHPGRRHSPSLRRLDDRRPPRAGGVPELRETDFVAAAGPRRDPPADHLRHILPGAMAPVVVAATLGIADSSSREAALSFLGFGIARPRPASARCSRTSTSTSPAHPG